MGGLAPAALPAYLPILTISGVGIREVVPGSAPYHRIAQATAQLRSPVCVAVVAEAGNFVVFEPQQSNQYELLG